VRGRSAEYSANACHDLCRLTPFPLELLCQFIINPLTAQYFNASDLRTAVAAWEALAASEAAKSSA